MVNLLKQKPKAEPKPVNQDFPIPDYRRDPRWLAALQKQAELTAKVRELQFTIDEIAQERPIGRANELAERILRGEPAEPAHDQRLSAAHDQFRGYRRASEIQAKDIEVLRSRICGEHAQNPELVAAVTATFRKTGAIMGELFEALKAEDELLHRLTVAGLAAGGAGRPSCGRAEWVDHPIFKSMKLVPLSYGANPLKQYLLWSRQHFGA
jgi:hypothetical protein